MNVPRDKTKHKKRIAISLGDPAGIGIEITLKALASRSLPIDMEPILIGCKMLIEKNYEELKSKGINTLINPKRLTIIDLPMQKGINPGEGNQISGDASFNWLTHASQMVLNGEARALVTAPIAKFAWHQAGHFYPGQTERLAEICKSDKASMLFTAISPKNSWRFNTLLATTHIPLNEVSKQLTAEIVEAKLDSLMKFCKRFKKHPRLVVSGLNPHAGEKGKLGTEEIDWLIPSLENWRSKHPDIHLDGPISPDTCWLAAYKAWEGQQDSNSPDGILALYHDQGLIPMKLIAFDKAVNTTIGLPFIRTSPDHGTGFDIAGLGCAKETSMLEALKAAWDLTQQNL